ncbi:hypothetical protein KY312_01155 [Candidatus Woesearchaeota archaeon]|nr:hypothetical protein [Candidatus Woesearchaeota archaeon]
MKTVRVIFSSEAEEVYRYLSSSNSKTENTILQAINKKIELIKEKPHYGNPIAKRLIPEEYKLKFKINNLFRIELPNYWRMLYSLTNNDTKIEIIAFILDLIDHKTYNKKFGY